MKLPLKIELDGQVPLIVDADGTRLLELYRYSSDPMRGYAGEIVRAVNSHESIVAALRAAVEKMDSMTTSWVEGKGYCPEFEALRAALALATK